jgi:hypothetical protein
MGGRREGDKSTKLIKEENGLRYERNHSTLNFNGFYTSGTINYCVNHDTSLPYVHTIGVYHTHDSKTVVLIMCLKSSKSSVARQKKSIGPNINSVSPCLESQLSKSLLAATYKSEFCS